MRRTYVADGVWHHVDGLGDEFAVHDDGSHKLDSTNLKLSCLLTWAWSGLQAGYP